jgi:hypothetical protein
LLISLLAGDGLAGKIGDLRLGGCHDRASRVNAGTRCPCLPESWRAAAGQDIGTITQSGRRALPI